MNFLQRSVAIGVLSWLGVGLNGCQPSQTSDNLATVPPTSPPASSPTPTATGSAPFPVPTAQKNSVDQTKPNHSKPDRSRTIAANEMAVNVYQLDSQCLQWIPKKTIVNRSRAIEEAVGKVLEEFDSGDFSVASYRVMVQDGAAIVDLRLPANAKRRFISLSACEQMALFGSIRKTLLEREDWKIRSVQFTEKGQEITL